MFKSNVMRKLPGPTNLAEPRLAVHFGLGEILKPFVGRSQASLAIHLRKYGPRTREILEHHILQFATPGAPSANALYKRCVQAIKKENAERATNALAPLPTPRRKQFASMIDALDRSHCVIGRYGTDSPINFITGIVVEFDDVPAPVLALLRELVNARDGSVIFAEGAVSAAMPTPLSKWTA